MCCAWRTYTQTKRDAQCFWSSLFAHPHVSSEEQKENPQGKNDAHSTASSSCLGSCNAHCLLLCCLVHTKVRELTWARFIYYLLFIESIPACCRYTVCFYPHSRTNGGLYSFPCQLFAPNNNMLLACKADPKFPANHRTLRAVTDCLSGSTRVPTTIVQEHLQTPKNGHNHPIQLPTEICIGNWNLWQAVVQPEQICGMTIRTTSQGRSSLHPKNELQRPPYLQSPPLSRIQQGFTTVS